MKANELREKSVDELKAALGDELKSQFKLRMQHATGQWNESNNGKGERRNMARSKTLLNEKAGE